MIGEIIEHYRILEIVGRGGMGIVYKAVDVNLDRTVAVKVLSTELRDDPEFVERFRHEARVQAALNHPNIAMLFDFFVWNSSPVAVMEFIEGETLQHRIQRSGPVPAHVALPIFVQALRGVAAGHRRGIIHRDLKPANLMITNEEVVKVTDFGIAKMQSATGLTQASTRIGSSSYMSPEQILGLTVDVRTDIYAMGVTLYELLCGRPPFQARTSFEIESAHVRDMPLPPIAYYPQIPRQAVDAVMRALAKDPNGRFATAEEFIQALPDLHGVPFVESDAAGQSAVQAPTAHVDAVSATDATILRPRKPSEAPAATLAGPTSNVGTANVWPARSAAASRRVLVGGIATLVVVLGAGASLWFMNRTPDGRGVTSQAGAKEVPPVASAAKALPEALKAETLQNPAPRADQTPAPPPADQPPATSAGQTPAPPPETRPTQPASADHGKHRAAAPDSRVASAPNRDLSGVWTGVYADGTGNTQLRVVNLEIRQISNGGITGSLTYKTAAEQGETCTLERSSYSKAQKRLRLIVHCHNPSHPRYLNVPLDFVDVDPGTNSLQGGKLEFHLADDIVVSLTRTRSA